MRIISKWHDYYDSVMKTGMDREVVYVRDTKELLINDEYEIATRHSSYYSIYLRYLGFCGHIYKIYVIEYNGRENFYYDFEEFKSAALGCGAASNYDFGRTWWKSAYDRFHEFNTAPLLEFFHKYQVPIFLVQYSQEKKKCELVLNPHLKDQDFHKIKDTYTTYQDIFQYVAGTLNKPENKMVQIEDKYKIAKHGFDKWSFRKHPTKKK